MVMWAFIAGSVSMLVGVLFGVIIADVIKTGVEKALEAVKEND